MPPSSFVGAVPVRLNIDGNGSTLPSMSVITDVVVDRTFTVDDGFDGLSGSTPRRAHQPVRARGFQRVGRDRIFYRTTRRARSRRCPPTSSSTSIRSANADPVVDRIDTVEDGLVTVLVTDLLDNDRDGGDSCGSLRSARPPTARSPSTSRQSSSTRRPASIPAPAASGQQPSPTARRADWMIVDAATGRITATVPLDMLGALDIRFSATLGAVSQSAVVSQRSTAMPGRRSATRAILHSPASILHLHRDRRPRGPVDRHRRGPCRAFVRSADGKTWTA